MAKSPAERQAKHRRKAAEAGEERINIAVSSDAKRQLARLAAWYGFTRRAMLEKLIFQGIVEKFNSKAKAEELLAEHGSRKKAMSMYYWELKAEDPTFFTQSKKPQHLNARRRYHAVASALRWIFLRQERV